jgi:hypothetical protein
MKGNGCAILIKLLSLRKTITHQVQDSRYADRSSKHSANHISAFTVPSLSRGTSTPNWTFTAYHIRLPLTICDYRTVLTRRGHRAGPTEVTDASDSADSFTYCAGPSATNQLYSLQPAIDQRRSVDHYSCHIRADVTNLVPLKCTVPHFESH